MAQTVVAANGHSYEAVITAPTCTTEGYTTYTCSVCEDTYVSDATDALGHTEVIDSAVAPTCVATGLTEGSHCSVCNVVFVDQEIVSIDATAHSWGEWTYDHETHTRVCLYDPSHIETAEHVVITDAAGDNANLNGSCSVCGHQEYVIAAYAKNGYSGYKILSAGKDFEGGDVVIPTEINNKPVLMYGNSSSGYQLFTAEQKASITSVYVPETLLRIGYQSFTGCNNLTEVTFAENGILDKIYSAAFKDCTSLTKIELPDSLDIIEYDAFKGCTSLSEVTFGKNLTAISSTAFYKTAIETIYIPASVTTIGNAAFRACPNLTTVVFDENCRLSNIASELFYECAKLRSINIPETVTAIQVRAFRGCSVLTNVTIPASVVTIGPEAFWQCDGLESIHIPSSVTSIGAPEELNKNTITGYTFEGCDNLKSVTFGSDINLSEIYTHTFSGCDSLESIVIPAGVKYIREYAFDHCTSLKSVTFMSNDNLQVIENNAFERCASLTEIAIPSSVTAIGDRAFAVCYVNDKEAGVRIGLKKVTFGPDSQLTTLGAGAFSSCGLMSECKLPDTVTSIGANAFYSCQSLNSIYIPAGVTTIHAKTFYGCSSAKSVYIPSALTTIEAEAFEACGEIADIYFGGTKEQWDAISIGTQTDSTFLTATCHYGAYTE